ncbi:uncharacterized protein LOC135821007 [Sycon ciliatum]|uniref:uncharacterized protein LOC135821007 n=1 Tax=Sycon ciliatum TaxID=27933 RepID=UPI0031F6446F
MESKRARARAQPNSSAGRKTNKPTTTSKAKGGLAKKSKQLRLDQFVQVSRRGAARGVDNQLANVETTTPAARMAGVEERHQTASLQGNNLDLEQFQTQDGEPAAAAAVRDDPHVVNNISIWRRSRPAQVGDDYDGDSDDDNDAGSAASKSLELQRSGHMSDKQTRVGRLNKNWRFYSGQIATIPHEVYIDDIHRDWWQDLGHLEYDHSYIQWLFPISESSGMNWSAQALQADEAKAITSDPVSRGRLFKSYKMMLNFYGLKLMDEQTGEVGRAGNWKSRYANLLTHTHNYLRITRIIKCLGEMPGMQCYQTALVAHLVHEVHITKELVDAKRSLKNFWTEAVCDRNERERFKSLIASNGSGSTVVVKVCEDSSMRAAAQLDNEEKDNEEEDMDGESTDEYSETGGGGSDLYDEHDHTEDTAPRTSLPHQQHRANSGGSSNSGGHRVTAPALGTAAMNVGRAVDKTEKDSDGSGSMCNTMEYSVPTPGSAAGAGNSDSPHQLQYTDIEQFSSSPDCSAASMDDEVPSPPAASSQHSAAAAARDDGMFAAAHTAAIKQLAGSESEHETDSDEWSDTPQDDLPAAASRSATSDRQSTANKNTLFYSGKIAAAPCRVYIDDIHRDWWQDLGHLEYNHSYIQWLFPISESNGMNWSAQALQADEAKAITGDPVSRGRLLKSYKMMLNFYGLKLIDEQTGEVGRAGDWKSRYANLLTHTHNYLRITRIIKCLGEMPGMQLYQAPLVAHLVEEVCVTKQLVQAWRSCRDFWVDAVADRVARLKFVKTLQR